MIRLEFNNLFVSTHGVLDSVTPDMIANEQIRNVVFNNGININFIRDLLHFQANIPRVYSKNLTMSHRLPFHELNGNAVISVSNTGNRRIHLHSVITVVPPIVENKKGMLVYIHNIGRQFYPVMTVEKNIFEKHLNELLIHLRATEEMIQRAGSLIKKEVFKLEIVKRLQDNLINNFIWQDITNACAETLNMQRNVNEAVWIAIITIMRHWMTQFNTTIGMVSMSSPKSFDELLEYAIKTQKDYKIAVNGADNKDTIAQNFKTLILRNICISRLVEHFKEINLISVATVREASKKFIDPGEKMTIVLI